MSRSISYSEVATALSCWAKWSFKYGGQLLDDGMTLHKRELAPMLSDGRAWGAGVQAWHSTGDLFAAHAAAITSVHRDLRFMAESGIHIEPLAMAWRAERIGLMLDHYMATEERLEGLTMIEEELDVPLPSRRNPSLSSSKFRFQGFLDGFQPVDEDSEYLVEFKLRTRLTPPDILERSRQIRDYAWARQRLTGRRVVGVIVDERLNVAPHPPNRSKRGKLSHAVDQVTTEAMYVEACAEDGVKPHGTVCDALRRRVWGQRHPVIFGPKELEETARELVSGAQLVAMLDAGHLYPIRNASAGLCRWCDFNRICDHPNDRRFVDTMFDRCPPKRDRLDDDETNIPTQGHNTPRGQLSGNPFMGAIPN